MIIFGDLICLSFFRFRFIYFFILASYFDVVLIGPLHPSAAFQFTLNTA